MRRVQTEAMRRRRIAKREELEHKRRIAGYLKSIGNDRSVVTLLRRTLAKLDMSPKKRMAIFSIARMHDDSMRFDVRRYGR